MLRYGTAFAQHNSVCGVISTTRPSTIYFYRLQIIVTYLDIILFIFAIMISLNTQIICLKIGKAAFKEGSSSQGEKESTPFGTDALNLQAPAAGSFTVTEGYMKLVISTWPARGKRADAFDLRYARSLQEPGRRICENRAGWPAQRWRQASIRVLSKVDVIYWEGLDNLDRG